MTWTTFATLTNPTTPELDANFATLSMLAPIPVTVSGTNALTLTSIAGASTISSYQNYMTFIGTVVSTNNAGVTASVVGIQSGAFLNVYKDTGLGSVLLTGSEMVAGCSFTLRYDSALNSGAGGFHLLVVSGLSGLNAPVAWTPTDQSGAGLVFTSASAFYQIIGALVFVWGTLTYPSTANGANSLISLPLPVPNRSNAQVPGTVFAAGLQALILPSSGGASTASFFTTGHLTNASLSTNFVSFSLFYPVA